MQYPQISQFMQEVERLYGDMRKKENRDKAFPNCGMDDRKLFDDICDLYHNVKDAQQPPPKQEGKKK